MQLLAFGCGYVAIALAQRLASRGIVTLGTTRSAEGAAGLARQGVTAVLWPGCSLEPPPGATWLISVPPDDDGCPIFDAFGDMAASASWIGYLSTTGVYGDLGGRWAFEETPRNPQSREATNRAQAEDEWLSKGAHVFRLPGIYGPGRSQLERLREPGARRIVKPGQVFSRAHRDDIATALELSIARPHAGAIYNICDDDPAPADEVLACAAQLLGIDPPPAVDFEDANLSPAAQRFYAECKRVSNARAKAELGWLPQYPTYREGLAACLSQSAQVHRD
jgi:nucleoside-diphosphate-sugar epimerase